MAIFNAKPPSFKKKRKVRKFKKRQALVGVNKVKPPKKPGKLGASAPSKPKKQKESKIITDPTATVGVSSVTGANFEDQKLGTKIKFRLKGQGKNKYDESGQRYWEDAEDKPSKVTIKSAKKEYDKKAEKRKQKTIRKVTRATTKAADDKGVIKPNTTFNTNDDTLNKSLQNSVEDFYEKEKVNEKNQPGYVAKELTSQDLTATYEKLDADRLKYKVDFDISDGMIDIDDIISSDVVYDNDGNAINIEDKDVEKIKKLTSYKPPVKTIQEKGEYKTQQGKLIGIIPGGETVTQQTITVDQPDFKSIIPKTPDGPARFARELKDVETVSVLDDNTELVYAFDDGTIKTVPYLAQEVDLEEIEIRPRQNIEDVKNIFKRELFFDNYSKGKYTDELFNPELDTLYEDPETKTNINPNNAFESATKKLNCFDILGLDIKQNSNRFNNSQYKAYGFYIADGKLYGNVDFDDFGLPVTDNPELFGRDIYTGPVTTPEGEAAPVLELEGSSCKQVKDFLNNNKREYSEDFDKNPIEKYDDLAKRINNLIAQVKTMQGDFVKNKVVQQTKDVADKINQIEEGYSNVVLPIVDEVQESYDKLQKLRKQYDKGSTSAGKKHDRMLEGHNALLARLESLQKDFFDTPLSQLNKKASIGDIADIPVEERLKTVVDYSRDPKTIVETPSGLSFVFNDPKADGDGGEALIYLEPGNESKSLNEILKDNQAKHAKLLVDQIDYLTKMDYADVILKDLQADINKASELAIEHNEELKNYLQEDEATLAQVGAFGLNVLQGTIEKIIPGLIDIGILLVETGFRIAEKAGSDAAGEYADAIYELEKQFTKDTEYVIDQLKIKPGLTDDEYDRIEQSINTTLAGKIFRTMLEVTVDVVATGGLNRISKGSKAVALLGGKRSSFNKLFKTAIYGTKPLRARAAKQIINRVVPTSVMMPRITLDTSIDIQKTIEQRGIELKPSQRLALTLGVSTIVSYFDQININILANPGGNKVVTYILSKMTSKPGSETPKQAMQRIVKELIATGAITVGVNNAVEISTEVIQENIELLARRAVNNQLKTDFFDIADDIDEYMNQMKEIAIIAAVTSGTISSIQTIYQGWSAVSDIKEEVKLRNKDFKELMILRDDNVYNQLINSLEVEKLQEIAQALASGEDVDIEAIEAKYNKQKADYKRLNEVFKKVPLDKKIDDQQEAFNLENEKLNIEEKLKQNPGEIEKTQLNTRLSEINTKLQEIATRTKGKEAIELEEGIKEQQERFEDADVFAGTTEEVVAKAKELGALKEDGKFLVDNNGNRAIAMVHKKGGKVTVLYDKEFMLITNQKAEHHETDHMLVDELEEEFGPEITFQIANQIEDAIESGELTVSEDYKNKIEKYRKAAGNDKQALADEIIANLGDDLEAGKANIKQSLYDKLKRATTNSIQRITNGEIVIDMGDNLSFIKFLKEFREGKVKRTTKPTVKTTVKKDSKVEETKFREREKVRRKPKRILPRQATSITGRSRKEVEAELEKTRTALSNIEEKIEKLKQKNITLIKEKPEGFREEAAKNTQELKRLRNLLETSNENKRLIDVLENPKSTSNQKVVAKNKLVDNNRAGIQKIIEDNYKPVPGSTITKGDFEIEVFAEFAELLNTYLNRDEKYKNVPFGAYVFGQLGNRPLLQLRVPGIFEKLIQRNKGGEVIGDINLDDISNSVQSGDLSPSDAVDVIAEGVLKEVSNLRKALGIEVGSEIYEAIKQDVMDSFGDKLPDPNTNKFKTQLRDRFRDKITAKILDMMGTPASDKYKNFLKKYGEEIYNFIPQDIINKSFQEFNIKIAENIGPLRVDEEIKKGNLPKATPRTSGPALFVRENYNEDKWINYHLKPSAGTPATKRKQLAQAISAKLGGEATSDVLRELGRADEEITAIASAIDEDPSNRFKITDVPLLVDKLKQLADQAVKQGEGQKKIFDDLITILEEDEQEVAKALLGPYFEDAMKFKNALLKSLKAGKIPSRFEGIIARVTSNEREGRQLIYSTHKRNKQSMQEMHDLNMALARTLPKELVDLLGPAAFAYDYTYLDSGEKAPGIFGPYKQQFEEFKAASKKSKVKSPTWIKDVKQYNAGSGLMAQIETVLYKNISKEEKIKLLKDKGLWETMLKANDANTKAAKLIISKITEAVANNPKLAAGAARFLEGQTNLTKSIRSLTKLDYIDIRDGSQAAWVSEDGTKFSKTKKPGYVINKKHGDFKEAKKYADSKIDNLVASENKLRKNRGKEELTKEQIKDIYDKLIAKKLRFKGEHLDPSAPLMEEILEEILNTADQIIKNPANKKMILQDLNAKLDNTLKSFSQILGVEIYSNKMDKALGETSKLNELRVKALLDENVDNYVVVSNETANPNEFLESQVINNEAVKEIIEFLELDKPKNRQSLDNSKVIEVTKDTLPDEILSKMATIDEALRKSRQQNAPIKKARVFDFDDTVAISNSLVFYTMPDGTKGKLTAEEFAKKGLQLVNQGAEMDFTDFNKVRDGRKGPLFDLFKKLQEAEGDRDLFILTARAPEAEPAIKAWLESEGVDTSKLTIVGLGNSSPLAKSNWFVDRVGEGYNDFYFADDAPQNVQAVDDVLKVADVKSKTQQAKMRFQLDGEKIADQLFRMTAAKNKKLSEEALRNISEVKAEIKGSKVRDDIFMAASAQNFTGLLYRFLGKGTEGDADYEFLKDNLVAPYTRALNEINGYQNALIADHKQLIKTFVGNGKPIKNLKDQIPGLGGYTYQDMIRVLAWDSQGIEIEGLPVSTLRTMRELAGQNPAFGAFADQLVLINKGDGYYYPGGNWRAGTILGDLLQGVRLVKRPKALQEWKDNIEVIFGEYKNGKYNGQLMKAIQATYGTKFREALEDMLQRMTTGMNRKQSQSRLENQFFNWLNNSVGAVMFFNMRSGLLQTLSSVNYINWSFNNPAKAAAAFANQKQYWKDFMELMNSDFLVDRRAGLKINISESEIFDAASTSKDKASAIINTFLRAGFSITQVADSFAIASGGATFYRNRIKDLLKQGKTESQAKQQAYDEWTSLSREAQQSSDALEVSSQQAGGLGRVILAFANTPMQYNRIIYKAFSDIKNRRGDLKTNLSRIAYYGALQNLMFNALQQAVFALIGSEDEEEIQEKELDVLNGMLDSLLRGMGISGSIIAALKDIGVDIYDRSKKPRPEYVDAVFQALNISPPLDVKVSKAKRAGLNYDYNRKTPEASQPFNIDNPAYMSTALVVAATTNFPLDRILQKIYNVRDAMKEDQENWKRIFLLLGWSEWQLNSKQENEEIRKLRLQRIKAFKNGTLIDQDYKPVEATPPATQPTVEEVEQDTTPVVKQDTTPRTKVVKQKAVAPKPKKVTFTENKSFKNNRVPTDLRNADEKKLYDMSAAEQRDSLAKLGLSKAEIKALKYEGDRVRKIIELQK